jgi:H+/Cl- antiporter ClcA
MWINQFTRFFIATLFTGCIAGLGGLLLVICLHAIQHIAFGYSLDLIISHISFYEGVSTASPIRRVIVLLGSGLVAGFGWWMLYHYGKPLVSIGQAIKAKKPYMPVVSTIIHAFLQIITIAMGSPLGREVAPREMGAMFSIWFSTRLKLNTDNIRVLLACGAGAGLAAVYNVPLGGALFTLEVLLRTFNRRMVLPALFTSILATLISRFGLGNEHQYQIFDMSLSYSLLTWSLFTGPIFGITALWFSRIVVSAP